MFWLAWSALTNIRNLRKSGQALLEDRFKLAVRRETKEFPVYLLTVSNSRPKLKAGSCIQRDPNTPPVLGQRPSDFCGFLSHDNNVLRATQIDMAHFAPELSIWVKRKVIDKTGITTRFDGTLTWNPDEAATTPTADAAPSIFIAL